MANVSYQDAGRVSFVIRGDYNSSATYNKLDVVKDKFSGRGFICTQNNVTNIEPASSGGSAYWMPLTDYEFLYSVLGSKSREESEPTTLGTKRYLEFYNCDHENVVGRWVHDNMSQSMPGFRFIPRVNISTSEWTAIQAIFNPSTTT